MKSPTRTFKSRLAIECLESRSLPSVTLVSVDATGDQAADAGVRIGRVILPLASDDGRYVVFESSSKNLVDPAIPDGAFAVQSFWRDTLTGVTQWLPGAGTSGSEAPTISADGRYVAFFGGPGLTPDAGPNQGGDRVYLRDTQMQTLTLVSNDATGGVGSGAQISLTDDSSPSIVTSASPVPFLQVPSASRPTSGIG